MNPCNQCPRACGTDRSQKPGLCLAGEEPLLPKIMLHQWEEPFLTGEGGSGALFFSGCNLRCVFCQNQTISHELKGRTCSKEELIDIMFRLKERGAVNINLVTAAHFTRQLVPVLREARARGLNLPVVWNSSGYESVESLRLLDGLIDVYLPDFKYMDPALALRYSRAEDYPAAARAAITEMVRQTGPLRFQDDLLMGGTVVRHLVLPGHADDSQSVLAWLATTFGHDIFLSIMNQYTPCGDLSAVPELNRRLTAAEYDEVVDYALALGIENALLQSEESQTLDYTPDFSVSEEGLSDASDAN